MLTVKKGAYNPGVTQSFTTTTSCAVSAAVGSTTAIMRVAVNQDTWVLIGAGLTTSAFTVTSNIANNNAFLIPAGGVEFFVTTPGVTNVAFAANSSTGPITITELA
jgi:hypothetical protein